MPAPTLLFLFAHPDDESFCAAGTAMTCAGAGARTVLVTATLGDRGKAGEPPVCSPEELSGFRERELRDAASIIGFDEVHLLGYGDQHLADVPPDEIRRTLVAHIRRVRPRIVFTFDPNGVNVHPDHVAISRFASDAIAAAADPRWYRESGSPHAVARLLWTSIIPPWDALDADRLGDHPSADFVLDVARFRDRRAAALRAHRTQHLSIDRHFFNKPELDRILAVEIWRQAWGPPLRHRPQHDVLSDV